MASTSGALPTGCHKCGRTGHWSRDCPSNPGGTPGGGGGASGGTAPSTGGFSGTSGNRFSNSSGFNSNFSNSSGFNGGKSWGGKFSDSNGTQRSANVPKEPIPKVPRKRPKLSPDLLLSEKGLGYVLEKMPEMVKFKGREDTVVPDLKSLLEGYIHWHSLLLPYFSFDQFVDKLEKQGTTKRVRTCTRELRDKIVYGKEDTAEDKEVEAEPPGGSSPNSTLPTDTTAGLGSEADHGISPPDDVFTNDDSDLPVNADEFEDFFRQGVVEPSNTRPATVGVDNAQPGLEGPASPVRKFPSLEDEAPTKHATTATDGIVISQTAAARMEANRLQAIERAKARRALNVEP